MPLNFDQKLAMKPSAIPPKSRTSTGIPKPDSKLALPGFSVDANRYVNSMMIPP
jgi:hypothetical protein